MALVMLKGSYNSELILFNYSLLLGVLCALFCWYLVCCSAAVLWIYRHICDLHSSCFTR